MFLTKKTVPLCYIDEYFSQSWQDAERRTLKTQKRRTLKKKISVRR